MQIRKLIKPPRAQRLTRLYLGLILYGVSDGMLLRAGLGVDPWDVLQQGLSRRIGLGVGTWANIVGATVLLLWIPLRQRPGFGTISNILVIGTVIDLTMLVLPLQHELAIQVPMLLAGVVLGPGPRDGLMTGIAARGHSIRVVRTGIELTVFSIGWLLGGNVGLGTVVYALSIGPLAHVFIPLLAIDRRPPATAAASTAAA
jgi:uncharacterized membrane protein YczE